MNEPQKIRLQGFMLAGVVIFGVTAILIVVLTNIYRKPSPPPFTGPIMHLSTGIVGEYSSLSIVAQEKGFFKENGLDVTLKDYISGPPAVADVLAGKLDLATAADFVGVINSFTHPELRIVAAQGRADSFFLVARNDRGLATGADLKGKRVGITRNTAGHFFLGQYLTLNQLSLSDVTLTDLPPDKLVEALVDGSLDAIVTFNPHISDAQKQLGPNSRVWSLQGDQRLSPLLYANRSQTTQRPEAIQRYLRALIEAENYIQMNNDAARSVVGSYLKFDDNYMRVVWSNITFDVSLDQDLLISMDDEARWAIENNVTTAKAAPDFVQYISFDALDAVKPEGITVIR